MAHTYYADNKRSAEVLSDRPEGCDALDAIVAAIDSHARLNDLAPDYWTAVKSLFYHLARANTLEDLDEIKQAIQLGREAD